MERHVLQKLKEWKECKDRKPLIVNGARQVGKTWALREFAKREYAKEAYIICRKNELVEQVFKQDFNVERILLSLSPLSMSTLLQEIHSSSWMKCRKYQKPLKP